MSPVLGLRRSILLLPALLLILFASLLPGQAHASVAITKILGAPIGAKTPCNPTVPEASWTPEAGTRSDFCLAYYEQAVTPGADALKSVQMDLPQGYLATADTSPTCTTALLALDRGDASHCPANAQVGSGQVQVRVSVDGLIVPVTADAKVWNMAHSPNEVASIGIEVIPTLGGIALSEIKLQGRVTLRPNPDVGLRTTLDNLPRSTNLGALGTVPVAIDGFFLRLWGEQTDHPSMPQSYGLLGSDCTKPQITKATGTSYDGGTTVATSSYMLKDCDQVPYDMTAAISVADPRPDVPTSTTLTLTNHDYSEPRVSSNLASTVVTLPPGLTFAAQAASGPDGLPLCTAAEFNWSSISAPTCPEGSKVGDIAIISPLQANVFKGSVYLGQQTTPGGLPQMFVDAGFGTAPDSPHIKLLGSMVVGPDGSVVSTLQDLPQVTFTKFTLTFRGGDNAPLVTPRHCGTTTGSVVSTPSSGNPPVTAPLPLTIDQDCVDTDAFAPTMSLTTSSNQAGATGGTTTIKIARPDRTARITNVDATLPPGLLDNLNGIPECALADAAVNACSPDSRIGSVTALSGVGPAPETATGGLYLTARGDGEVAGVEEIVPVKFGDVDLGTLALPAKITLNPDDFSLRFSSAIPTLYHGLPLDLRQFTVSLDRPGFGVNPTSCNLLSSNSVISSDVGSSVTLPTSIQMTGCSGMSFAPQLTAKLSGQTSNGGRPVVNVQINLPAGGANIHSTNVTLPPGLSADLAQIKRACSQALFEADQCPPTAIVGSVSGGVAIAPDPLVGDVYLVNIAGQALPGVGMHLTGRFAGHLLGILSIDHKTQQLVTTFASLPDDPITQLNLSLGGGSNGPLIATSELCATGAAPFVGHFVGQGGQTVDRTSVASCAKPAVPTVAARFSGRSGSHASLKVKLTAPKGKMITKVVIKLPSGVTLNGNAIKHGKLKGHPTVSGKGGSRSVTVKLPKGGSASPSITLPASALKLTKGAKKQKSLQLKIQTTLSDGTTQTQTITVGG